MGSFVDSTYTLMFETDNYAKRLGIQRIMRVDTMTALLQYMILHSKPDMMTIMRLMDGPIDQKPWMYWSIYAGVLLLTHLMLDLFRPKRAVICGTALHAISCVLTARLERQLHVWEVGAIYATLVLAFELLYALATKRKSRATAYAVLWLRVFFVTTGKLFLLRRLMLAVNTEVKKLVKRLASDAMRDGAAKVTKRIAEKSE